MINLKPFILLMLLLGTIGFFSCKKTIKIVDDPKILSHVINTEKQQLKLYWKLRDTINYANFKNLKSELQKQNKEILFATNGGMYKKDKSPKGLYIENGITFIPLDTINNAYGNFYLQPNGVFYITKNGTPNICISNNFKNNSDIEYATQSGPMLVIDGEMHSKFNKGSSNSHTRNGVGVLPNGNLLFAMSKEKMNFYDFASYFKKRGCKNALYLDGFVSRTYLPSKKWEQLDGDFGVIIAEIKNLN